jgi:galactose dehydrogenase
VHCAGLSLARPRRAARSLPPWRDPATYPDLKDASVLVTGGGFGHRRGARRRFRPPGRARRLHRHCATSRVRRSPPVSKGNRWRSAPLFIEPTSPTIAALEAAVRRRRVITARWTCWSTTPPATIATPSAAIRRADWDANHAVNLRPHFFTAQAVAEGMKRRGKGAIVNFSSIAFMINGPEYPVYAAAKAGVIG